MNKDITTDTLDILQTLVRWDIDDAHAYHQVLDNLDDAMIKEKFKGFLSDHQRHIRDLSGLIRELGGEVPEYSRDFKGYLISGYTAIRSMMGTKGALEAMQTNEKMTLKRYENALQQDLLPNALALVSRNLEDERNHLRFIETTLETKAWH